MLAYVFSHRPAGGADVADYEAALKRFHAALATAPPAGFLGSSTFRVGDRYSDWYLVANSAALDLLNEAAVSGARSPAGFEIHFSKPAGTSYADLYERMQPFTGRPETSLWRRMMVLGPPPEFCLLSPSELELPREYRAEVLQRDQI